jgi:hypothetical protein
MFYYVPSFVENLIPHAGQIIEWVTRLLIWGRMFLEGYTVANNLLKNR